MKFFDNLFDVNNKDEQLITGLNKELNSIIPMITLINIIIIFYLLLILYMRLMIYIIDYLIILIKSYFFLWMIL